MLKKRGAVIVDADAIARAVTAPGGAAIEQIRDVFGQEYLTTSGALDRDRMRALAFAEPNAKARLEGIVHPLVRQAIALATQQALESDAVCVVYDIPLLVESGQWRRDLDRVIVVDCASQTQIQRVQQRNGLSTDAITAILEAQAPRLQRLRAADAVLCNDGITFHQLEDQVSQVWTWFGL